MFVIATKKDPSLCPAYRCKNKKADKKAYCHKHHHRYQAETNPIGHCYSSLKQNAKRRGKEFNLTIPEFEQFCKDTNYIKLKGKSRTSASIDRIDPDKGYEINNLQVLKLGENSSKRWEDERKSIPF